MIASTTRGLHFPGPASALPQTRVARNSRRIGPEAGLALEKLGHAIEYLSQVFARQDGFKSIQDDRLEAIELLMRLNREIYFECPEVPTLRQRFRAFLRRLA